MSKKEERSTWGSKRERGKNSWQLRYTVANDRRGETVHGTKSDAERRLAELRLKYEGLGPDMTLSEFWSSYYYPHIQEHLAASTVPGYERVWRVDIEPAFGDAPLSEITPRKIQAWLDPMTGGKAKHAKAVLSAMLSRAFALELVDDNAAQRRYVMPKAKAKGQRSREVYTKDEFDEVFYACRGEVFEGPLILSGGGGASREESMGVMLSEIKFQRIDNRLIAIVPIVRGVQRLDGQVKILDWTKNEYRQRDLIIEQPYSLRLKEIVDESLNLGYTWIADDGYGNPLCPNTVANSAYRRWFQGQPYKYIPFSNLRHTYTTYMSKRVDAMMMAKLLGHSQPTTTYNNYYRPTTEDKLSTIIQTS